MPGYDYLRGHASTPKGPGNDQSWSHESPGPFIGVVMNNIDPLRMGRLQVNIEAKTGTTNPAQTQLITCEYLSPFFGNKDIKHTAKGSTDYEGSQHSYGFWAVPPDIGTRVLVIFAEGKMDQAFWIGCVQDPVTNHMVPGIASSEKTFDQTPGVDEVNTNVNKQKTYGTTNVPAGELNRRFNDFTPNVRNYETYDKPIHPMADVLLKQGLIQDTVRGTTSSSARRETPSQVFGISTPGRKDTSTVKKKLGTNDSVLQDHVTRGIGHTFVMDDGAIDGTNQLTRIRTASGHQILMHDTEGTVYIANGSGKSWIEMDRDGKISIYSKDGMNVRTGGDFNLHSDKDINFHAKNKIKFTAEQHVALNAEKYVYVMGQSGILNASQGGAVRHYARDGISSYTDGTQLHGAAGRIDLAGSQVHFNSVGARRSWGPSWLKPDHARIGIKVKNGLIDVDVADPINKKTNNKTTVTDFVTHEPYNRK